MNLVDFVRPSVLPRTIVKGERSRKNRNWVRTKYRKFSSFLKWHRYNNTYVLFSFFFFLFFTAYAWTCVYARVYLCMCRCARVSRLHVLQDVSKFFTLTNNNTLFTVSKNRFIMQSSIDARPTELFRNTSFITQYSLCIIT